MTAVDFCGRQAILSHKEHLGVELQPGYDSTTILHDFRQLADIIVPEPLKGFYAFERLDAIHSLYGEAIVLPRYGYGFAIAL